MFDSKLAQMFDSILTFNSFDYDDKKKIVQMERDSYLNVKYFIARAIESITLIEVTILDLLPK